ncbi:MAG: bifunctional 4-hydroxy-2-oxoglutarate aldolase/2-dehydro-3-deoxy-phosphogluconate aldolase [Chloroflexi bacterium]|nr:MAG: bifunctional 4-hydroxy-2-oxoglutarate aldolase/2-dehydro-3-deoxy-phosphogluconate aldolase [Chloroflexota bacterium]
MNKPLLARLDRLLASRVIAIVRTHSQDDIVPLARAIVQGGIDVLEVALTSPGAIAAIGQIASEVKGAVVGAGTVLDERQGQAAIDAGSQFLISPGFSPRILRVATKRGIPYIPGALTPTELITIFEHGLREIKIFPAGSLGPSYIRELLGPFPNLRAIPTGGVTTENARAFLEAGAVALGVGGALTGRVPQGSYDMVAKRTAEFRAHLDGRVEDQ